MARATDRACNRHAALFSSRARRKLNSCTNPGCDAKKRRRSSSPTPSTPHGAFSHAACQL
eukprot:31025-Pelagococcus_subviridis.AAC.8